MHRAFSLLVGLGYYSLASPMIDYLGFAYFQKTERGCSMFPDVAMPSQDLSKLQNMNRRRIG